MTAARDLADRFHHRWLEANPFTASMYGIPGYDDLVPDESNERSSGRTYRGLSYQPQPALRERRILE
jgi:hypothetical protein